MCIRDSQTAGGHQKNAERHNNAGEFVPLPPLPGLVGDRCRPPDRLFCAGRGRGSSFLRLLRLGGTTGTGLTEQFAIRDFPATLDTLHGSVPLFPDFTTFFDGCKYNMDDHAVQKRLQMYRPRAMLKEIEREKGVGNNEKMHFPGSGADSAAGGLWHAAAGS